MHQTINPLGGVMISNSNEMLSRINILLNLKTLFCIPSSHHQSFSFPSYMFLLAFLSLHQKKKSCKKKQLY